MSLIQDTLFFLELNHSWLRDDDLKITTTSSGLLTKADIISTDRTGDIIVEIAKAIAMFGVGVPLPGGSGEFGMMSEDIDVEAEGKVCYPYPLRYDEIVDFENYADFTDSNNDQKSQDKRIELKDSNGFTILDTDPNTGEKYLIPILSISLEKEGSIFKAGKIKSGLEKNVNPLTGNNGILYRRDGSHLVNLLGCKESLCAPEKSTTLATRQISMPNISPPLLLPYDALPLVTTTNKGVFENGMLVSYDTNQPSSVLELARLPARVLEGMLDAVTNLIQLRFNYSSESAKLAGSEIELVKKLDELKQLTNKPVSNPAP